MNEHEGDYWSGVAEYHYERELVEEARDIVAGRSTNPPRVEHLRVLIAWLDGATAATRQQPTEAPF